MRNTVRRCFIFAVALLLTCCWQPVRAGEDQWTEEQLIKLLRELSDEAERLFLVKDPHRRVYGMMYEFVRDGQQVQDFGLDAMHDGAWFMSALITAHRVDPDGGYLQRAQMYQVPFYVNVLTNSDKLFPHMLPREGQEKFAAPIKGWAPRGWDDGPGIDLVANKPFSTGVVSHDNGTVVERDAAGNFEHAYFTSSHHLLQDLADSLLNVWLTTRDPEVARAILLIHENRLEYGHRIPVVQKAAGLANGLQKLYGRPEPPAFDPQLGLRPLWQGLVQKETIRSGRYDDGLAWTYREECARAALENKPLAAGFAANGIGRLYAQTLATEAYFGPERYRHGYLLSVPGVGFAEGTLASRYETNQMLFARGLQYGWLAAALLPSFRADPAAWQQGIAALKQTGELDKLQTGCRELGVEFQTDPDQVAAYLDAFAAGSIDYWAGVRGKLGYLPRAYFPDGRSASWSRVAELGAYAHLMKLVAFRLMELQGTTERDLIVRQVRAQPLPHQPLPNSVLRMQGLK